VFRTLLILLLCGAPVVATADRSDVSAPYWFVGQWEMASDEDNSAPYDLMEFRPNNVWVDYGPGCKEFLAEYHVYGRDIYVTSLVPDKGPIAMVFRPSEDHRVLTYTSPRTRHNAMFKRPSQSPCNVVK
jgi:hypothetical protein